MICSPPPPACTHSALAGHASQWSAARPDRLRPVHERRSSIAEDPATPPRGTAGPFRAHGAILPAANRCGTVEAAESQRASVQAAIRRRRPRAPFPLPLPLSGKPATWATLTAALDPRDAGRLDHATRHPVGDWGTGLSQCMTIWPVAHKTRPMSTRSSKISIGFVFLLPSRALVPHRCTRAHPYTCHSCRTQASLRPRRRDARRRGTPTRSTSPWVGWLALVHSGCSPWISART